MSIQHHTFGYVYNRQRDTESIRTPRPNWRAVGWGGGGLWHQRGVIGGLVRNELINKTRELLLAGREEEAGIHSDTGPRLSRPPAYRGQRSYSEEQ